jgi:transcriptional regulator with XRE-family HTH domain
MATNTLTQAVPTLGAFLRECRRRLAPAPAGQARRRTPGLRREEVAERAGMSAIWYTWLEQGRGGLPSTEVLERLVGALELDKTGREMLFLLAHQHRAPLKLAGSMPLTSRVQSVLDAMPASPAIVMTPAWDVVAWNQAARVVLADYEAIPPAERNVLRRIFCHADQRVAWPNWEQDARFAAAAFRFDVVQTGGHPEALALVAELRATSADFRQLWDMCDVRDSFCGRKLVHHPVVGAFELDYTTFVVAGAESQRMIVFTPASPADAHTIARLLTGRRRGR